MSKDKRINNDMQNITRKIIDQATQNMYDNSIITLDEYIRLMSTTMNFILKKDRYQNDGCHFRHHSVTEMIYLQFLLSHDFQRIDSAFVEYINTLLKSSMSRAYIWRKTVVLIILLVQCLQMCLYNVLQCQLIL